MDKLLFTAPDNALPEISSVAYELLALLNDRNKHPRDYLCDELGGGFRVILQKLTGGYYQHWLIHKELGEYKGKRQAFYWLDERHFSGDWELDKDARTIARKRYNDRSYYGSKGAVERLEKATKDKCDADREYQKRIKTAPEKD